MKIGIFGGSFNPIHIGHISLARQLRQLVGLDEVWLMVSPQNPLKQQAELLNEKRRFAMANLALRGEEGLKASDYELHLPKPSYTWNTLQHLEKDFPQHTFTLLIGGDNWERFDRWYHANDILSRYPIVIYPRRGCDINISALPPSVQVVQTVLLDISSTEIRQRVQRGESIAGMVPESIEKEVIKLYT